MWTDIAYYSDITHHMYVNLVYYTDFVLHMHINIVYHTYILSSTCMSILYIIQMYCSPHAYQCLFFYTNILSSTCTTCPHKIGNQFDCSTLQRNKRSAKSFASHLNYPLTARVEGPRGTTDDFATSILHFSLFSTALWHLANSRPVRSLMLSSHLFLCLPCLLPTFTVLCKMVLARPDERETWPYHCCLRLFPMVRRSSCGPIACWYLGTVFLVGNMIFVWDA